MTYNLNIDDKPIILIHSPTVFLSLLSSIQDHRFQQQQQQQQHRADGNRLVFFTIYNTDNPKITLFFIAFSLSIAAKSMVTTALRPLS